MPGRRGSREPFAERQSGRRFVVVLLRGRIRAAADLDLHLVVSTDPSAGCSSAKMSSTGTPFTCASSAESASLDLFQLAQLLERLRQARLGPDQPALGVGDAFIRVRDLHLGGRARCSSSAAPVSDRTAAICVWRPWSILRGRPSTRRARPLRPARSASIRSTSAASRDRSSARPVALDLGPAQLRMRRRELLAQRADLASSTSDGAAPRSRGRGYSPPSRASPRPRSSCRPASPSARPPRRACAPPPGPCVPASPRRVGSRPLARSRAPPPSPPGRRGGA